MTRSHRPSWIRQAVSVLGCLALAMVPALPAHTLCVCHTPEAAGGCCGQATPSSEPSPVPSGCCADEAEAPRDAQSCPGEALGVAPGSPGCATQSMDAACCGGTTPAASIATTAIVPQAESGSDSHVFLASLALTIVPISSDSDDPSGCRDMSARPVSHPPSYILHSSLLI